jgi:hypothetical protein
MSPTDHDEAINQIKRRRLAELEKQHAYYGPDTRPHILMEISELRQQLGLPDPPVAIKPLSGPPTDPAPPVESVVQPPPSVEPPTSSQSRFQQFLERLKDQSLVLQMAGWLLGAIIVVSVSVQAFEPPSCLRWVFLALANLAGGVIILWFSVQPENRQRYSRGDRLLTVLLVAVVVGVALWFGYPICSQPNSVPLSCTPADIALF